ncbi:MAG: alpha-1,2-fucosyltransferase [Parachlamydiaceae bacterium]|nr:alpha-1,2-fucosyltransferase [Parachlamydiaceae bacterium]
MKNFYKYLPRCIFIVLVSCQIMAHAQPFVTGRLWGRLGNHLFIVAAVTSLAIDNGAEAVFPDFMTAFDPNCELKNNYEVANLRSNYQNMFSHLNVSPPTKEIEFVYREPSFSYTPIPYYPDMLIEGWFQSEKYFLHNKQIIQKLFAPSPEIYNYLSSKYIDIINDPNTVSIHLRCYKKENPIYEDVYPTYGRNYVEKAIRLFNDDAQFIVFSDQIEWAQEQLKGLPYNIRFIE